MSEFSLTIEELKPYCKDFNQAQLQQALQICLEYRLTPVKRQIHIEKRWTKNGDIISPLVTIDGLRGIAERSDKYEGQVGPFWCGDDGKWVDVWLKNTPPVAAKVGVHKRGFRDALYAVAKFEEYKQTYTDKTTKKVTLGGVWGKMPDLMVAKCAEALALRRAFPDELGGLYTKEEMAQAASNGTATADTPEPAPAAQSQGITPSSFSMAGEPDPANPFTNSEDRKAWMVDVKAQLDEVEDEEGLEAWLAEHGGHLKWLGNFQLKAMNEQINNKRAKISNAAFDRAAKEKAQ